MALERERRERKEESFSNHIQNGFAINMWNHFKAADDTVKVAAKFCNRNDQKNFWKLKIG